VSIARQLRAAQSRRHHHHRFHRHGRRSGAPSQQVLRRPSQRALASAIPRAQTHVASTVSPLGLVRDDPQAHARKPRTLRCASACLYLRQGRGTVKSAETVCHAVFREIVRHARQFASRELLILAHQDVVDRLLGEDSGALAELEASVGRPVRLQSEALYEVDQYDVVLM
jgi:ribonuclease G